MYFAQKIGFDITVKSSFFGDFLTEMTDPV